MNTLVKPIFVIEPIGARITSETLGVDLADGRTITVPLQWFPRLLHGTPVEWANYELSYEGVHWPDLNEDISVEALLRGEKSGESPQSIKRWLGYRDRGEKEPIPELPLPPKMARELEAMGIWKPKEKPRSLSKKSTSHDHQKRAG